MQTCKCLLKLNDYHVGNKVGVTPVEALILQRIHNKEAGGKPIQSAVLTGDALTEVRDKAGNVISSRLRTNAEEVRRLKAMYPVRAKSGAPGTHIIDDLYPGVNPQLPQTFAELGIEVADAPIEVTPAAHPESVATTDDKPVSTPVANPPLSAPLLHANELLQELARLEALDPKDLTKEQARRLKQLSVLKPAAPATEPQPQQEAAA